MDQVERWLRVFHPPGSVLSIQALYGPRSARSWCTGDLADAARKAVELEATSPQGVYFTLNPIRPDLAGSSTFPKDEDMTDRRWLAIDIDPRRPSGTSSTQAEMAAAWAVLDRCRGLLDSAGLAGAVIGFAGNGWHLCYPICMPNDAPSKDLVKQILKGLDTRCSDSLTDADKAALKAKEYLGEARATVGTECHDAKRIWACYGTFKRKGESSPERPHRWTSLIEGEPWEVNRAGQNTLRLRELLGRWKYAEDLKRGRPQVTPASYVAAALRQECQAVAQAVTGDRNNQLNRSAFALGQLVGAGALAEAEAEGALLSAAEAVGLGEGESRLTIRSGLASGATEPRDLSGVGTASPAKEGPPPVPNADTSEDPLDQDATVADLLAANVTIRWGWEKWLPLGVLSVLASEPGIGKTRFCADLARRAYHGLPWPDGMPPTFMKGARTLWVPADNQHAELGSMAQTFGIPPEALLLNATRRNPFAGTMLDGEQDLRDFEARIRRTRPAIIFVDTSLNATDRSAHKPEDAKAFFVPLQQIAARTGVAMICVTHLNAAGKPLGRRIQGQARLVMQLEKPDPDQEHRRKLYVVKSNSLYPAALGVTMGLGGNEYDLNPPATKDEPGQSRSPGRDTKSAAAADWLADQLQGGQSKKVKDVRAEAELEGIGAAALYRAKDQLGVLETTESGRKWWRLPGDDEPPIIPWGRDDPE